MANSLLDFVMSLVRDPDAAAAYAADPAQAIADADLTDVTSVDVNNLIPVVAESLSMAVPSTGVDALAQDPSANVWASGAATAAFDAFDAFDDQLPAVAVDDAHSMAANLVTEPDAGAQSGLDVLTPDLAGAALRFEDPVIDEEAAQDALDARVEGDWTHAAPEDHHLEPDNSGFDIFD
jgi:hypothetical protein